MNLTTLTDEELDMHCMEVLSEKERRENLKRIPEQIAIWANKYAEDGGNREDLRPSVDGPPQPV